MTMKPQNPMLGSDHDSVSRRVYEHPRILEDLVLGFAESAVGDLLDMSTLKQVPARHVSDGLQQSENDMIWEVRTREGGLLYVYVMLEFQSRRDWTMPLRMANYVGQFYRGLLPRPEIQELRSLPQVLPIVIYSGKPPWKVPKNVEEMIDRTLPGLVPYRMQMPYLLLDVWRTSGLSRSLRNVADSVFRLQRAESAEAAGAEIRTLAEWLAGEEWESLRRVLERWIMRVFLPRERQLERTVGEDTDLRELGKLLEVDMRTWEDNFREAAETRGRTEGRTEGRTDLLLNMVRQKFGEESAAHMAPVLAACQSEQALDEAGVLLLKCETGEDLLAKVREI